MKKEFIIGLSVLIAVLILVFGINFLKGINIFKAANYYTASYTNVAGLTQSAPVTINGFKVGIVREINYEYDNPGHVLVEFALDEHLRIPRGTKAVISSDMLGTASVHLIMPPTNDFHNVGDKLIGETAPGLMDNVSQQILPAVVNLLPKIDSILTSVSALVANPALSSSISRLDNTMQNIEKSSVQLNRFMTSMPAIAGDAKSMMNNLNTVSADLTQISATIKNLPIDTTMQNVEQATLALKNLMTQLNNPNSTLGALTTDRTLYNNLNQSAASLDSLLKDVKQNPKRYINIKVF